MTLCQCGHPQHDRDAISRGHARGEGTCLACLGCDRDQGPHVLDLCGCQVFSPIQRVPREQASTQGGVPCICAEDHYRSTHDEVQLGGRCRARDGDNMRCDCPGYEPDPRYLEDEA